MASYSWAENAPEVFGLQQPGLESISREVGVAKVLKQPLAMQNYTSEKEYCPPEKHPRNPFGLRPLAFGILVALVSAIIAGGAVGGGLGGILASCRAAQQSSISTIPTTLTTVTTTMATAMAKIATATTVTTTTTTTSIAYSPSSSSATQTLAENYTVLNASSVDTLAYTCADGETYTSSWGQTFTMTCNADSKNGLKAAGGGVISDLVGTIAYSLDNCFEACSAMNSFAQEWGAPETCQSITWRSDLKNMTAINGANCWLKNATLAAGAVPNSCSTCVTAAVN